MGNNNGDGDGQWRWQLRLPTVTETAMADGKGNSNSDSWRQRNRDSGSDGQRKLQQQWPTATAMAIGYGDINSNGNRDSDGNCNGNGHGDGDNDKGRVASSCAGNVQQCGRGKTLPPPPWTQRIVHSPALCHGGDTAKSVSSLSRGRVPDSSPWIVSLFIYLQLMSSLLNNLLFAPLIIQALKNPVSPLMLYLLHSSKNPVSLLTIYPRSYCTFCQGKPRQGLKWL